jgi:cbb3-type cytochrome oxidase maturation protein
MNMLMVLIPVALGLGAVGLWAFLWSLQSGQYEDLQGAAHRILVDPQDEPRMIMGKDDVANRPSKP